MENQKRIKKLNNRLKGWHRHFKGRFLLLKEKILTEEEFVLWDLGFTILADWDKKNRPDEYGTFSHSFAEIAYLLNCDRSTISRRSKKLFKLGLWKRRKDGSIEVAGYTLQEHLTILTKTLGVVNLQQYIADPQQDDAIKNASGVSLHDLTLKENEYSAGQHDANMHDTFSKDPLISYKDKFSLLSSIGITDSDGVENKEQYQLIKATIEKLKKLIGDDWISQDKRIREFIEMHDYLENKIFRYELEHSS